MRSNFEGKRSLGGYFTALALKKSKPASRLRYFIPALSSRQRKPANIKISLFIVLFCMIAGLAGLYFSARFTPLKKIAKEIKVDSDASLVLNSMHHTSIRNGVKEWTLKAASAKVLKNDSKAIIMDIAVEFFLKNGEQIDVTAHKGYINTKENNMELSDNVVVKYGESVMTTDQLHYDKKSHIIYSDEPVTVIKNTSVIKSDTMKLDLNKNTLELKGNVYAILSDALDFSPNRQQENNQ
ncbi:MAG: LPS export ABC transporter periplasmic protein LptC [Desulfamplus sp.]|nr:LPS export ABC transporter periplasmic protein LptC [Desulfamplus sp.]